MYELNQIITLYNFYGKFVLVQLLGLYFAWFLLQLLTLSKHAWERIVQALEFVLFSLYAQDFKDQCS